MSGSNKVGNFLKQIRERQGITRRKVLERMTVKLSMVVLQTLETGSRKFSAQWIAKWLASIEIGYELSSAEKETLQQCFEDDRVKQLEDDLIERILLLPEPSVLRIKFMLDLYDLILIKYPKKRDEAVEYLRLRQKISDTPDSNSGGGS